MSEFKGTKGEWKYSLKHGNKNSRIVVEIPTKFGTELILERLSDDDCTVASCCCQESHANALLISKAPEMLEMLEFIRSYGLKCNWDLLEKEIEKLIKEATELK